MTNSSPTIASLNEYLEQKVKSLSTTKSRIFCHVLTDTFHNQAFIEASPKARETEYLKQHHVILIFQERSIDTSQAMVKTKKQLFTSSNKTQNVLVMGMSVFEYCEWQNPTQVIRSYIQYIDTTGLFEPREDQSFVTKSVASAYISYLQNIVKAQYVHLLATAKPNYLFAGSEFINSKKELSTEKLVYWWLRTINDAVGDPAIIYAYAPGEWEDAEDTYKRVFGFLSKKEGIEYKWGMPFNEAEPINLAIPLFEDDPKWKHYQKFMEKKNIVRPYVYAEEESEYSQPFNTQESLLTSLPPKIANVKEFLSTMSARPEFVMEPEATFIIVKFPKNEITKSKPSNHLAGLACKMLKDLTFEDEEHVISSSTKILSWLKFMGSKIINIQPTETEPSKKIKLDVNNKENENIGNTTNVVTVLDIQQSVRRDK